LSFLDKLGTFAKNLGAAPFAPARFIYEAASATWRDEEQYNGFINTIKTAGTIAGKQAVAPVLDVFEGIETVAKPIRQAGSTVGLALEQSENNPANLFKKETWDKAQQYKDEVSIGQSLYAQRIDPLSMGLKSAATLAEVFGVDNTDRFLPQFLREDFDIFNPVQREQAYKKSLYGRYVSGVGDITAQVVIDPTLVGTKILAPIKAAKVIGAINNGDDALNAINLISKAQSGEVNKFTSVLDEFANNDTAYALGHPLLSGSDNKPLIASLLGQSKTPDEVGLVLRSSLADPVALTTLRDTRFELAQQIDTAMGKLKPYQADIILNKTSEDGMLPFPTENADEMLDLKKELDDLIKRDRSFAKMMNLAETPGGSLVRTTGSKPAQMFDSLLARGRAAKFYDQKTGTPDVDVYQPSPFSRMYQKVSWLENERPAGFLDFNDPDSYREVVASLDRAKVLAPDLFDDIRVRRFVEAYSGAVSPSERQQITLAMESTIWRALYTKYGIRADVADNIYNTYQRARKGAIQSIKDKGYMIDIDDSMIHVPQLQSQTADWLPIMDFDLADKLLKRHASNFKLLGDIGVRELMQDGVHGLEIVNDLFKAGALIRLGYTIRNGVDNQLRIMSAVGAQASFQYAGEGIKNIGYNMGKRGLRAIDNVKLTPGVAADSKKNFIASKKEFDKARTKVIDIQRQINDLNRQLARDPEDVAALGKLGILDNELQAQTFARDSLSKTLTQLEQEAVSKVTKKRVGESKLTLTTPMGETYELDELFGGTYGDLYRQLTSAESTWNRLADSTSKLFESRFISKGIGAVKPEDANYFEAWARTLNTQFVGDPVVRKLAAGEDPASIAKWLDTGDGRQYRKDLNIKQYEGQQHVDRVKSFLNRYVPNADLQRRLFTNIQEELIPVYRVNKKGIKEIPSKKPQGIYYSAIEDITKSPFREEMIKDYGIDNIEEIKGWVRKNDAVQVKPFDINLNGLRDSKSFIVESDTGIAALKYFAKNDYSRIENLARNLDDYKSMSSEFESFLNNVDSSIDWNRFTDNYERLTALGSVYARKSNVKALVSIDKKSPEFSEVVVLSDDILLSETYQTGTIKATPEMLRETFKEAEVLPIVHGDVIEENLKNLSAKKVDKFVNFAMKWLGSVPEDVFARHPLVNSLYRDDLRKRVTMFEEVNKRRMTADELWKLQQTSKRVATANMKKIVFNIDRRTNLGHFMRLIAPFFSAQENAYKTWLRLVKEKPYLINRANIIWNAPNRSGLVTDEEGNPVNPDTLTRDGVIWVEVPPALKNAPFIGGGLESLTQIGISKQSLDVVFGGDFNIPLGPYVAIGVGQFVKRVPTAEKVLGWATPYGPPENTLDALAPTWVKRQLAKYLGESSPDYAKTYQLIWLTEQQKAKLDGLPPVPESRIKELTDQFYNMRTVANLVLPFSPRFASPYKMHMDKYRELQREYGREADVKFLEEFGEDYFAFATSLSSNKTRVQASIGATENIQANKDLVASVFGDEPALVGLIVNNPTGMDFSEAAYQYQYNTKVAPGSTETFRGTVDPAEAQRRNNARLGWIKYRKIVEVLDAKLVERGLSSYSVKGAADLKMVKDAVVTKLATNPDGSPSDWYIDYLDVDGSKTLRVINGLNKILEDDKFMSRNTDNPTWKSIATYLKFRDLFASKLAERQSGSLDAKSNTDLKLAYDVFVQKLKQDDLGFSDVYDRFLSQDKIYYKAITKVAR
jgi:hypothetical protein